MKLISVIIPAYNYADVLSNAVNSVLRQLDPLLHELIVINDGSTDETEQLLISLKEESQVEFEFYTKPNGGLASTRNFGVKKSVGDFLIFLDADDEMEEGALEKLTSFLQKNPEIQFLVAGYISIWPNSEKSKVKLPECLSKDPLERVRNYLVDKTISLANGATVMHRSVFSKGMYPEKFRNAEDIPVFAQVLANFNCDILPEVVLRINKHADSLRHNTQYGRQVGLNIIEETFHSGRLPDEFGILEKPFYVQRCLSLFRGYYISKDYVSAKEMFILALKADFTVLFKFSYSGKFFRMLFKAFP